mgnify:CR=1 FL=1
MTDGSVSRHDIGITHYITRDSKIILAGFVCSKLHINQKKSVFHAKLRHKALLLLLNTLSHSRSCRSTVFVSPTASRVSDPCRSYAIRNSLLEFLSTVSHYQVDIQHFDGSANIPSDFANRNAAECDNPNCQICSFTLQTEGRLYRTSFSPYRATRQNAVTRSTWINIQCPDVRRTYALLKEGVPEPQRSLQIYQILKDKKCCHNCPIWCICC